MDRRSEPRADWNTPIKYRKLDSDTYKKGILANMGTNSALLWLSEELAVGSSLDVQMRPYDMPEHVFMHVVRTEETNREGYRGYGCKVEMTLSEAA